MNVVENQTTLDFAEPRPPCSREDAGARCHTSSDNDEGIVKMTQEEHVIWSALKYRLGKDSAVLGPVIAECARISYTEVRAIISHLVNDHGKLIASCGRGYYIPQTPEEIFEATRSLRHRGIMILRRASRLQNASLEEVFGQARMEFEK